MLAILASSTILIIISFLFEKYVTTTATRRKISLSALMVGGSFVAIGGFKISEAVGFFSSAAVLLLIAFLFGFDRG